ncbi:MAG: M15 family metallopeptidase [Vicinamibacteria bacterium]
MLSPPHPHAPAGVNPASALGLTLMIAGWVLAASLAVAQPAPLPARPSPSVGALVGEYGEGKARLVLRESNGALEISTDGKTFEPVCDIKSDLYQAAGVGAFKVERGVPVATAKGSAVQSVVQGISIGTTFLARRDFGGSEGVFHIVPVRPVADLAKEVKSLSPPKETGEFLRSDLVDVRSLDKSIALDVRYATTANFLQTPVYGKAQVRLQRPAAEALVRAHRALKSKGYGLMLHDGYRPWSVTWIFWNATPDASHDFVADPSQGSKHNRGCAIDLTLFDLKTKKAVDMPGLYDEMSPRSYPDYQGGTARQRALREILRRAMENEGFTVYDAEWWHFDYKDWQRYAIGTEVWWKN